MRRQPWILMLIFLFTTPGDASAHGSFSQIRKEEALVITSEYDDGEPMSYAEVKIYSPTGGKTAHQVGRMDKNGRFAFVPDGPGEWRVTVEDGMGHRTETSIGVDETQKVSEKEPVVKAPSKWQGVVSGLSIIFGLTGILFYFRARKSLPRSQ